MKLCLALIVTFLLSFTAPPMVHGQSSKIRLEGDWVRIDPDGVGSFGGLSGVIPAAQLLPGVTAGRGDGRGRGGRGGRGAPELAVDRQGLIPKVFPILSWLSRVAAAAPAAATAPSSSIRILVESISSSTRTK